LLCPKCFFCFFLAWCLGWGVLSGRIGSFGFLGGGFFKKGVFGVTPRFLFFFLFFFFVFFLSLVVFRIRPSVLVVCDLFFCVC